VLVRHAKAAQDAGPDEDRALTSRGAADAPAIGRWLAAQGLSPGRVVVSPARRARQTWGLAGAEMTGAPEPVLDERIYGNTVDDLLGVVHDTPAGVGTLVLVGHNPSMEGLATTLDGGSGGSGDTAARREMAQKYPTSGVAVLAVADAWADLEAGGGALVAFTVPRG